MWMRASLKLYRKGRSGFQQSANFRTMHGAVMDLSIHLWRDSRAKKTPERLHAPAPFIEQNVAPPAGGATQNLIVAPEHERLLHAKRDRPVVAHARLEAPPLHRPETPLFEQRIGRVDQAAV
jgi:hypothetical protein